MHTILRGKNEALLISKKRKYFVASDLHLEFRLGKEEAYWEAFPEHREAKVCLCAGDLTVICQPDRIVYDHFGGLCKRFDKVIYAPGNHEYYGSNPSDVSRKIRSIQEYFGPTLTVLRAGEPYVFDGQRFVGDTLWFPDRPEVHIYRRLINDVVQIRDLFPWCFTQSHLFMSWIGQHLEEDDIVISHHVPNDVDTLRQWKSSPTQAYFVNSDCHRYFMNPNTVRPKAWIYGHTHDKHDYHIGRTRFICNPVGYPGENSYLPAAAEPAVYEI